MVSYLPSKDTRYWLMLQGFYFNKSNSTQNIPDINVGVSGLDNKNEKSKEIWILLQILWAESNPPVRQKYRFEL